MPIRKAESLQIKVRITREFKLRLWIAARLIRLAAVVAGGSAQIEIE
jgi:hypothetical protein